jgi:hypothetical protein
MTGPPDNRALPSEFWIACGKGKYASLAAIILRSAPAKYTAGCA